MATSAPNMASADSCPITLHVAMQSAVERPHVGQISPDKNMNFRYAGKQPAGYSKRSIYPIS